jgi:hypothetical protein
VNALGSSPWSYPSNGVWALAPTTTTSSTTTTTTIAPAVPRAPSSVRGTSGNGQINVLWAAPMPLPLSPITDYMIQYSSDNGVTWLAYQDSVSTATSVLVTGLTNGSQYRFRVAAVNALGSSPWSYPSNGVWALAPTTTTSSTTTTTTIAPAVPRPPTTVKVVPGVTQVSVSWAAPTPAPLSPITDYIVQYSTNYGRNWTVYPDAASTGTSLVATGLLSGSQYQFRVAAVNAIGTSLWSSSSVGVWVS